MRRIQMLYSKDKRIQIFAEEIVLHGANYSDAFRKSHPHCVERNWKMKTIHNKAHEFAKSGEVQGRIEDLKFAASQRLASKFKMTLDDTLTALVNIARFDPIDLFNENGTVKDIKDIPQHTRRALIGLELGTINQVDAVVDGVEIVKPVTFIQKYRQESRIQALGKILDYQLGELDRLPEDDEIVEETDLMQLARRILHLVYKAHQQKEIKGNVS